MKNKFKGLNLDIVALLIGLGIAALGVIIFTYVIGTPFLGGSTNSMVEFLKFTALVLVIIFGAVYVGYSLCNKLLDMKEQKPVLSYRADKVKGHDDLGMEPLKYINKVTDSYITLGKLTTTYEVLLLPEGYAHLEGTYDTIRLRAYVNKICYFPTTHCYVFILSENSPLHKAFTDMEINKELSKLRGMELARQITNSLHMSTQDLGLVLDALKELTQKE